MTKETKEKKQVFSVESVPQYQSHKKVRAAKIVSVKPLDPHNNDGFALTLESTNQPYEVSFEWWTKHEAKVGGYVVFYADGYVSWSPAEAFEGGYYPIEKAK